MGTPCPSPGMNAGVLFPLPSVIPSLGHPAPRPLVILTCSAGILVLRMPRLGSSPFVMRELMGDHKAGCCGAGDGTLLPPGAVAAERGRTGEGAVLGGVVMEPEMERGR